MITHCREALAVITGCDNTGMLNTWERLKMAAPSSTHNSSVISDDDLTDVTKILKERYF